MILSLISVIVQVGSEIHHFCGHANYSVSMEVSNFAAQLFTDRLLPKD